MNDFIRNQYARLPNPTKAAIATLVFGFVTTLLTTITGLLPSIVEWSTTGRMPDFTTAGTFVFSAFVATSVAIVNLVVRSVQAKIDPAAGPHYPKPDAGA